MIVKLSELKSYSALSDFTDEQLFVMCNGVEDFIRQYTNNTFQNKNTAYNTPVTSGRLEMVSPMFSVGDTIYISNSLYNNGVFTLEDAAGTLSGKVYDCDKNRVVLVQYPAAVKMGFIKLLEYSAKMDSKAGIASESISRHSVSYQTQGADSVGGYPASMMTFLRPYLRARF